MLELHKAEQLLRPKAHAADLAVYSDPGHGGTWGLFMFK